MQAGFNAQLSRACEPDLMPIRALLVDDNESFLAAASGLLEREGLSVVGTASSAAEARVLTTRFTPDVILVDIVLGAESGFDLARTLVVEHNPKPAVILISTHAEADFADLVADSPARGFLPKSELSAAPIRRILGLP
jgi:DNA-binding NarL/FixJ family response regulator